MAKLKSERSETEIDRLLRGVRKIRNEFPDLTLSGLEMLLLVAAETQDTNRAKIPGVTDLAAGMDLTPSGASRLASALSEGRPDRPGMKGMQLLERNDWEGRRHSGFLLSPRGRAAMIELVRTFTGNMKFAFDPHDRDSMFAALFRNRSAPPRNL